ncbi:hypothetical protein IKF57_01850 [Candidatus Saccharibacteria bacterium]|nr:hypothetical protein [Candidatus Saccharibacteria bacterium]
MGVIVNKENNLNDELSRRIDADLRAKMSTAAETSETPDFAEDSDYVKDFKKTGKFGWVWIILIFGAAISLFFIIFP